MTAAGMEGLKRHGEAADALATIGGSATGVSTAELAAKGFSADTLARLAGQGLIGFRHEVLDRDPFDSSTLSVAAADPDRQLTIDQESALKRLTKLAAAGTFRAVLLHGVTGSGKTEIYLRLAAAARAAGAGDACSCPRSR